ncbi:MAG: hypothetical protein KDE56_25420 [Anaerolineales bacterium]|nr:hypothetical protein [Anaerolineales bacterium]
MTTSIQPQPKKTFTPSAEQLARATARRRFNFWAIYFPLIVVTIGVLVLVGFMVWGVLVPEPQTTRSFVSGLADLLIILAALPMALVCGAVPLAVVGYMVYRRQQKPAQPALKGQPVYGRLQKLFWQLDNVIVTSRRKSDELLPKVAQPIIRANALLAYVETWFTHLKAFLTRSSENDAGR